ncbi:MAG TPA: LCP family protein [Candidatus Flavonifractor merdipullorum]|uniref:LCP family protein n=1 Tax=Candidatus Flavonifractor merdipullorum TaxID=2838590 RepID=A0A9D1RT87_9FIRM|nr:LCP family protein [Candidatus Flavonifractor merdipullorum]
MDQNKRGGARLGQSGSSGHGKKPRRKWRDLTGQQKLLRIAMIVAAVAVVIAIGVAVAGKMLFVKPTIPTVEQPKTSDEELELVGPKLSGDRKENFFTFLVIGRDTGGGGNTDTILLAAYDVDNQQLNVMSIPRDTMVNVSWDIKKINSVYNMYGGGDEGIEALGDEVSQLVGFVPDYQVIVEWEAVGELVDAIGGVYFDVPIDMNYEDPTQDLHIHVDKGYQHLDGDKAMQVIRYRHDNMINGVMKGYPNGDLGRIETQQAFLKAVVEQCLQIQNITRIGELAEVFNKNVTTNLSVNNLLWFGQQAVLGNEKNGEPLDMDNVNFMTMPNEGKYVWSRTYHNEQSYVVPLEEELIEMVNTYFNPYLDELTSNELDIMSVDENGRLHSTSGTVEDTKAASASGSSSSGSSSGSSGSGSSGSSSGSSNKNDTQTSKPSSTPSQKPSTTPEPVESATSEPSQTPDSGETQQPSQTPEGGGSTQPSETPSQPPESSEPPAQPTSQPETPSNEVPAGGESGSTGENVIAEEGGETVLPPEAYE